MRLLFGHAGGVPAGSARPLAAALDAGVVFNLRGGSCSSVSSNLVQAYIGLMAYFLKHVSPAAWEKVTQAGTDALGRGFVSVHGNSRNHSRAGLDDMGPEFWKRSLHALGYDKD